MVLYRTALAALAFASCGLAHEMPVDAEKDARLYKSGYMHEMIMEKKYVGFLFKLPGFFIHAFIQPSGSYTNTSRPHSTARKPQASTPQSSTQSSATPSASTVSPLLLKATQTTPSDVTMYKTMPTPPPMR
jgi:hypothetical protein